MVIVQSDALGFYFPPEMAFLPRVLYQKPVKANLSKKKEDMMIENTSWRIYSVRKTTFVTAFAFPLFFP